MTVNTDDPLIFNQSVSQEYQNLYAAGVLNAGELDEIRCRGLREPEITLNGHETGETEMNRTAFSVLEATMLSCMEDSAHDREHIYRVLYTALDIAATEPDTDTDVLICACLLHDIGRAEQFADPKVCHAKAGSEKAYRFMLEQGFLEELAAHVRDCIRTHRFRRDAPPQSLEAKILFDADKLDAAGAVGIARTLIYKGEVSQPLYTLDAHGRVADGEGDCAPSFFQEYRTKLEGLYGNFYTPRGRELALQRQAAAVCFYNSLYQEVSGPYEAGNQALERILE